MSSFLAKSLAGSLVCLTTLVADHSETYVRGRKHHRLSARHIEGRGIGYDQGYSTLEAFFAHDPGEWCFLPFLDVKGHISDNGKWAANAGLGIREIYGKRVWGLNGYYDYRNTRKKNYTQAGVGLETLGDFWDFRINGYIPLGKKISSPYSVRFEKFSGPRIILSQKYQYALKGSDAELGFHFGRSRSFKFYAAAGPYYYRGKIGDNIWGGKARMAAMYKDYITLEVSDSYDNAFRNRVQGQITFTIPFGRDSRVTKRGRVCSCEMAEALTSRMLQPVGRQEIIPVDSSRRNVVAGA